MNWVRYSQLNKLGVSMSLPNLLPKVFGLSPPFWFAVRHRKINMQLKEKKQYLVTLSELNPTNLH